VVTNNTVGPIYLDKVVEALTKGNPNVSVESVILPDGEKYKDMVRVQGFRIDSCVWGVLDVALIV
jgi:3-dehydroquinate synthetase